MTDDTIDCRPWKYVPLKEGDRYVQDGFQFVVTKNSLGTLYGKSLGQIGWKSTPRVSIEEYRKSLLRDFDAEAGASTLGRVLKAMEKNTGDAPPEAVAVAGQIHVTRLDDLYSDLFSASARRALSRKSRAPVERVTVNEDNTTTAEAVTGPNKAVGKSIVLTSVYPSVRVRNRRLKEDHIEAMVDVINALADRGFIYGALTPLSSIALSVFGETPALNWIDRIAEPTIGTEEAVFIFPMVPIALGAQLRNALPQLFFPEGMAPNNPLTADEITAIKTAADLIRAGALLERDPAV